MKRIQLKRTKGWRLSEASTNPNGVQIVDRRTKWGNPFGVTPDYGIETVLIMYRNFVLWHLHQDPDYLAPLKGKDLACWCATDDCHASVLLELANSD